LVIVRFNGICIGELCSSFEPKINYATNPEANFAIYLAKWCTQMHTKTKLEEGLVNLQTNERKIHAAKSGSLIFYNMQNNWE